MGHYQLRVVGRYWSRRYPDFGHPIAFPPRLAYRCKPCRRSDDHLCGNVCGTVSYMAHGSCVERVLRITLPYHSRSAVGKLQLSVALGRICNFYILYRITVILVLRFIARYGNAPRPCQIEMEKVLLRSGILWMDR